MEKRGYASLTLPRPSIQLMAVAFLSVQKFPLTASTSKSVKWSAMNASAFSTPLLIMFMPVAEWTGQQRATLECKTHKPIASPVVERKRM